MHFDQLLKSWRARAEQPDAVLVKGKGCHWAVLEAWRLEYRAPLVFTLNNEDPVCLCTDLHFDVHVPRHHPVPNGTTVMVHWSSASDRTGIVPFPVEKFPRRKFGCTTAYMAGLVWLLLDTWPRLRVAMPGCNYNATMGERGRERDSINYWVARIEQRTGKPVRTEARSRMLDRTSEHYRLGRFEEESGLLMANVAEEDYR